MGCVTFIAIAFLVDLWLRSMFRHNPALKEFNRYLTMSALLFSAMVMTRVVLVESTQSWADGGGHHLLALEKMQRIQNHGVFKALEDTRPGNPFFQTLTALLYSVTGPYPQVVYVINGALGYMAMVNVLDILVRVFPRAPKYLGAVILLLPSAWFWTPVNLKEGPMLWCIAALLRSASLSRIRELPIVEMATAGLLGVLFRPHIFLCWIAGVGFTNLFRRFNIVTAIVTTCAGIIGFNLIETLLPGIFGNWRDSLDDMSATSMRNAVSHGGSAVTGRPIPFLTGATLIFLRPYPWEVFDLRSLASGLEIWGLTGLGILGWFRCKNKLRLLKHPIVMTSLVAMICLCLPFSYFYNMGLLVRQRLQVYPGILVLCLFPHAYNAMALSKQATARLMASRHKATSKTQQASSHR